MQHVWRKYQGQEIDLEYSVVAKMIRELNIGVYPYYFDLKCQEADFMHNNKLNCTDYSEIVQKLVEHMNELTDLFSRYSQEDAEGADADSYKQPSIPAKRLAEFFREEQHEVLTDEECEAALQVASSFLYTEYGDMAKLEEGQKSPNALRGLSQKEFRRIRRESEGAVLRQSLSTERSSGLSMMGFSTLLFSRTNEVLDKMPFQTDMNYPLSYYWINTSHFTYLSISPETGCLEVSAKNYSKYLLKGVRCVDISLIVLPELYLDFVGRTRGTAGGGTQVLPGEIH
ncbi:MAG: phosphatidylinositol-specific phospholipase C domain-containing protein [Candidatus Pacebacteria bacterium]|nr:phosphatidylinositol-specific phospholipase C domain-containing protein [Candidatus Paceibacterota bacterium]